MEGSQSKVRAFAKLAFGSTMALYISTRLQGLMDENHADAAANRGTAFAPFSGFREQARFHAQQVGENMNTDLPVLSDDFFVNKDGLRIHWRCWLPLHGVHPQTHGIVILSHDIAEHCARYSNLARELNRNGYAVFALDHQGHGRSEGDRLYTKWFGDLVADVLSLAELAKTRLPQVQRHFLLGVGVGATIAIQVARESSRLWSGVLLIAPVLAATNHVHSIWSGKHGSNALILLSGAFPKVHLHNILPVSIGNNSLLRDRHLNDPLTSTSGVCARLLGEIAEQFSDISSAIPDIDWPFLLVTLPNDDYSNIVASQRLHDFSATKTNKDKCLMVCKTPVNEMLKGDNVGDLVKWMDSRKGPIDPSIDLE